MTRADPIAWWYGLIDFERRVPQPGELKLDQMRALLQALGNPDRDLHLVHVAGSKGKGSTSAMLAGILGVAGLRAGLFTSPHLTRVEERFQIGSRPIDRVELLDLLAYVRAAAGSDLNPTFFEVATAVGFLYFDRHAVDLAVIEVGLGGRFDSTNVCRPLLSIVTSISLDHMQFLGDTLAEIAFEKAGILKAGVPALSGATALEAAAVIEHVAAERGCPLLRLGHELAVAAAPGHVERGPQRVIIRTPRRAWPEMELALLGAHQADNAALAVAAIEELQKRGFPVSDEHVRAGLARVRWPARLELLGARPWIFLDCAHNTASVEALLRVLAESFPPGPRQLIFAASADKDVRGMIRLLAPHFDRFLMTRYRQNQRGVAPEQLAAWLSAHSAAPVETYDEPRAAWVSARTHAGPDHTIVISGSVFLAGELRDVIRPHYMTNQNLELNA